MVDRSITPKLFVVSGSINRQLCLVHVAPGFPIYMILYVPISCNHPYTMPHTNEAQGDIERALPDSPDRLPKDIEKEPQKSQERGSLSTPSVSRTNLDYFDAQGVGALRLTLSGVSVATGERTQIGHPERPPIVEVVEEAFDFEAVLRGILKRYTFASFSFVLDQGFHS